MMRYSQTKRFSPAAVIAFLSLVVCGTVLPSLAGTTIEYSYDRQHRLVQASYSESEKVCYSYDAANNLDTEVSITDAKYLKCYRPN